MHLRIEAIAGITTFFTMAYIVVVNPTILSTPGTGMAFSGVLTATVLVLPCFFLAPLAGMVPAYATAPVLILVGASMFRSVNQIDFGKIEEGLPAFLTIILIPLTFSITQGILWGFISHVGLYAVVGRRKEIHPVMFILALVAIGLLLLEHSHLSEVL